MDFSYNWLASLATLALTVTIIAIGRQLAFRIPALKEARKANKNENSHKWDKLGKKYHHRIKSSQLIALVTNLVFFICVLPFFVTFENQSLGKVALDVFLILMIYDFFYYLTHRFLFHGKGYFRRVHAVHHQARSRVTSIDALLLHPWEVFIGIALFFVVTTAVGLIMGGPFHVATIVISSVIYTQINQINHCKIELESFPFKTLNWIALKHDAHHLDMHKGNYATITLLYDKLFGTLETHPLELEQTTVRGVS